MEEKKVLTEEEIYFKERSDKENAFPGGYKDFYKNMAFEIMYHSNRPKDTNVNIHILTTFMDTECRGPIVAYLLRHCKFIDYEDLNCLDSKTLISAINTGSIKPSKLCSILQNLSEQLLVNLLELKDQESEQINLIYLAQAFKYMSKESRLYKTVFYLLDVMIDHTQLNKIELHKYLPNELKIKCINSIPKKQLQKQLDYNDFSVKLNSTAFNKTKLEKIRKVLEAYMEKIDFLQEQYKELETNVKEELKGKISPQMNKSIFG